MNDAALNGNAGCCSDRSSTFFAIGLALYAQPFGYPTSHPSTHPSMILTIGELQHEAVPSGQQQSALYSRRTIRPNTWRVRVGVTAESLIGRSERVVSGRLAI
jgi:hypothetical protein